VSVAGNQVATGVELLYTDDTREEQLVQLTAPEGALRRQAIVWMVALQRVSDTVLNSQSHTST